MSSTSLSSSAQQQQPQHLEVFHRRSNDAAASNSQFGFYVNNVLVYEWEQTIDEVILYLAGPPPPPPSQGTTGASAGTRSITPLQVEILPTHLRVGLKGASTWFIDEDTFGKVDTNESTWTREDNNTIVIYLQKANQGLVWECALTRFVVAASSSHPSPGGCGGLLNPLQLEQVRQELLRERWTRENPGMDFSSATFNGQAPDPRTFMGGCKYE